MNDRIKNICPACKKELLPDVFDIEGVATDCWCCYECNIISSPYSIYKVDNYE